MKQLMKLVNHYYVIDDEEIKEGDYCIEDDFGGTVYGPYEYGDPVNNPKRITHSTQKIEGVELLDLIEIEGLIYNYNLNEMAEKHWKMQHIMALSDDTKPYIIEDYKAGFIASHKLNRKLNGDKLFTIMDVVNAFKAGGAFATGSHNDLQQTHPNLDEYIKSIQPNLIWNISINDKNEIILL